MSAEAATRSGSYLTLAELAAEWRCTEGDIMKARGPQPDGRPRLRAWRVRRGEWRFRLAAVTEYLREQELWDEADTDRRSGAGRKAVDRKKADAARVAPLAAHGHDGKVRAKTGPPRLKAKK